MTKLKPCPFCGGDAKLKSANFYGEFATYYRVNCTQCDFHRDHSANKSHAIEIWDTRAETPIEKAARFVANQLRGSAARYRDSDPHRANFLEAMSDRLVGK